MQRRARRRLRTPGSVDRVSGSPWKLVIFDNDGVVVDSEPLAEQAMSGALSAAGYPMTPEECGDALRGTTLVATRRIVEERSGRPLPPDFEDRYSAALFELMRTQLRPVPGIEMVLDRLDAAGMAYCLASSGRRERVEFALSTVGLLSRFGGHWWGAEDVVHGKPAPDLFLLAAEKMAHTAGRLRRHRGRRVRGAGGPGRWHGGVRFRGPHPAREIGRRRLCLQGHGRAPRADFSGRPKR